MREGNYLDEGEVRCPSGGDNHTSQDNLSAVGAYYRVTQRKSFGPRIEIFGKRIMFIKIMAPYISTCIDQQNIEENLSSPTYST